MPTIGNYKLHVVETGTFGLDGGAMFGVVPKPLWERRIKPDERNRIPLAMRCMLIEGSDKLILVDNGIGDKYDPKFAGLYNIDHETYNLDASLEKLGFGKDEVTDVILTHLHFDHAGGSTRHRGDDLEIVFPNATFHVQQAHWESANAPNPRESASFFRENLEPLASSGQLNLLDGPRQLFDGISVDTFSGHSEAMQTVTVHSESSTLVFCADLLPTSHHLAPAWTMGYDVRPLVTMQEKADFLSEAIDKGWKLFFEHDPFVQVGDVEFDDRNRPVVINQRSLEEL